MAWALLVAAGVLEVVWAVALKLGDGFTRPWPSAIGVTAACASFVLLATALRTLPAGTAYAVWVGIGIIGVAAYGILFGGEPATISRLVALALILAGVVVLRLVEGSTH